MFKKISHNRLKNSQNIAKMLWRTPKTKRFSGFLSHFSKVFFERGLIRQFQRFALPAAAVATFARRLHASGGQVHAMLEGHKFYAGFSIA